MQVAIGLFPIDSVRGEFLSSSLSLLESLASAPFILRSRAFIFLFFLFFFPSNIPRVIALFPSLSSLPFSFEITSETMRF